MSGKKLKWTDVMIIIVVIIGFGYFYQRFDLDVSEDHQGTTETDAVQTKPQIEKSVQHQSNPELTNHESTDDEPDSELLPCDKQMEQLVNHELEMWQNITDQALLDKVLLYLGMDIKSELSGAKNQDEQEEIRDANIAKRLTLLSDEYEANQEQLIGHMWLELCVQEYQSDACTADDLLQVVDAEPENLAGWLLYYRFLERSERDQEGLSPIIDRFGVNIQAADYFNNYQNKQQQLNFSTYLESGSTPMSAFMFSLAAMRSHNNVLPNSVRKMCQDEPVDLCRHIGEILVAQGKTNIKMTGLDLQSDYYRAQGDYISLEAKIASQESLQLKREQQVENFHMPLSDQMAMYMIDMLYIDDDLEYNAAISQEAERLRAENPDLCVIL